jgi:hypothetical protein
MNQDDPHGILPPLGGCPFTGRLRACDHRGCADTAAAATAAGRRLTASADHQFGGQWSTTTRGRTTGPVFATIDLGMSDDLEDLIIPSEKKAVLARVYAICGGDARPRLNLDVLAGAANRYPAPGTEPGCNGLFAHGGPPLRATMSPRVLRRCQHDAAWQRAADVAFDVMQLRALFRCGEAGRVARGTRARCR